MTMEDALRVLRNMHTDENVTLTTEQETAVDYAIAALSALISVGADSAET